jgi:hypothetical protein
MGKTYPAHLIQAHEGQPMLSDRSNTQSTGKFVARHEIEMSAGERI